MELHGQHGKRMSATTRSVAKVNAGLILATLRERGPLSRREIALATGLSRATVNRLTDALLADSVVVADRTAPSTGAGRRGSCATTASAAACWPSTWAHVRSPER